MNRWLQRQGTQVFPEWREHPERLSGLVAHLLRFDQQTGIEYLYFDALILQSLPDMRITGSGGRFIQTAEQDR